MKRYRLKRDLPTFKEGELFHTDENGNLWRDKGQKGNHWQDEVMAYHHKTIERFPDILTDWFEEYEERDPLSKEAFIEYLRANPEQRLMQAVRNFLCQKLGQGVIRLRAEFAENPRPDDDTWNWECDQMMLEAQQQKIDEPEFTTFEEIEKRKQMQNQLREWAKRVCARRVAVFWDEDNDETVRFRNDENWETDAIEIKGWPRDGLKNAGRYDIEYLLGNNKG